MYFSKRGDKKQLCKRLYNWFRRKLNTYKYYLTQLFPTNKLATTHIKKQKRTKAVQYAQKKRKTELKSKPCKYPILQDNMRTEFIDSSLLLKNIDYNSDNNVSLHK